MRYQKRKDTAFAPIARKFLVGLAVLVLSSLTVSQTTAAPANSETKAGPVRESAAGNVQAPPQAGSPVSNCTNVVPQKAGEGKFWEGGGPVLLGAIPALIWATFAIWAVIFLSPQIVRLIERLRSFKGFGVEMEFTFGRHLEQAARNQGIQVGKTQLGTLVARISRVGNLVRGLHVLWVDDEPKNNIEEQLLLSQLGALIVSSESTVDALSQLRNHAFDVVISDMKRGSEPTAGLSLLQEMRKANLMAPVIIYTGTDQSNMARPAGLFGITNRPDELIHLVLDVCERHKS
jgi:CheY-like chemotaxis protein